MLEYTYSEEKMFDIFIMILNKNTCQYVLQTLN